MSNDAYDLGYSLGFNIGSQLRSDFGSIPIDGITKGLSDVLSGEQPSVPPEAMQQLIQAAQMKAQQEQMEKMQKAGEENTKSSAAFLAEKAQKDGVRQTESGILYEVLQAKFEGDSPSATTQVTVHYHGMLPDGTVFDSSVERGQPATFSLNQVIKGWTEGVQLMKVGEKFRFFIPADLAYGDQGAGPTIGPNQALVFEVELLSIS
ncbi:MAG: FKBP-type peptidyl-prolyl cis-trans isomerase [Pseudomonadota bacterium]|nr:FKBP-type peptidyl-prolyl cis-trans isomerase [Pseudomonadota bacterium]